MVLIPLAAILARRLVLLVPLRKMKSVHEKYEKVHTIQHEKGGLRRISCALLLNYYKSARHPPLFRSDAIMLSVNDIARLDFLEHGSQGRPFGRIKV